MEEKRKGGGAKTARSEIVTVRLDSRLRYLAEIAAKVQRRTLSSFIESAVVSSLDNVYLDSSQNVTVASSASQLWFVSEPARLARLNTSYPHLLDIHEQRLVRAASEASCLLGTASKVVGKDERELAEYEADALRPYWDYLKEATEEDLPMDEIMAGVMTIKTKLETGGPATAERIDKRIGELNAKHKADVAWLLAKKRELEGVSEDARTAKPDGLGLRASNAVGLTRIRLGDPNAMASARLGLGDPGTAKSAGLGVRLGQPKPKATK